MPLGGGLSSLIPPHPFREKDEGETPPKTPAKPAKEPGVSEMAIDRIRPNPYQPREGDNEEGLHELARSIQEVGIIQPLVVSTNFQLIAGERRLKAAKIAGLLTVPVVMREAGSKKDNLSVALIENIQRKDLNPVELARAYAKLQDEFGLTQKEIATRVGKSREAVANTLRLLNLPSHIQEAVARGRINESQARALLAIKDLREQERMFSRLLKKKVSTRKLREYTRKSGEKEKPNQFRFWEHRLEEHFGVPAKVKQRGKRWSISFSFNSKSELQSLLDKLLGEGD